MVASRLLAGQLLIMSFGVVYLAQVYGFPNRTAAIVIAPTGIGYLLGTIGGAVIFDRMHKAWPDFGRVAFLQSVQIAFGVVAFLGTQFNWGSIYVFCGFFFMMGCTLGALPGANRPIVMAVVPPRLRSLAFVILIRIRSLSSAGKARDRQAILDKEYTLKGGSYLCHRSLLLSLPDRGPNGAPGGYVRRAHRLSCRVRPGLEVTSRPAHVRALRHRGAVVRSQRKMNVRTASQWASIAFSQVENCSSAMPRIPRESARSVPVGLV
ncbi:membrane protein of unknown function [Burkholderia multivorans]